MRRDRGADRQQPDSPDSEEGAPSQKAAGKRDSHRRCDGQCWEADSAKLRAAFPPERSSQHPAASLEQQHRAHFQQGITAFFSIPQT